ncbi:transposase (plasmid) [Marinovum sp. KMM 9989]
MTKLTRYSAEFKSKVAVGAIREELTTAELAKTYGRHPTIIGGWKKTAIKTMAFAFGGKAEDARPTSQKGVEKRHAKIGQLVVKRNAPPRFCSRTGGHSRGYDGHSRQSHLRHWS